MGVLEAVDDGLTRELVGLIGEDLLEAFGDLPPHVDDAGRGGDVIVFAAVEHLDDIGVVGAGPVMDEPADL